MNHGSHTVKTLGVCSCTELELDHKNKATWENFIIRDREVTELHAKRETGTDREFKLKERALENFRIRERGHKAACRERERRERDRERQREREH